MEDLPEAARDKIIKGHGNFPGVLGFFDYLEQKKYKMHVRIFISRYRGYATMPRLPGATAAAGSARRPDRRQIDHRSHAHDDRTRCRFFCRIWHLTPQQASIAERILAEIRHRLDLLVRVGLDYIALDRLSSSLSGGESQRIQLATSLGSTLVGALYVLDEPSIGLHPRDSQRLIEILKSLKSLGNTVLVVEHDPEIMRSADYIVDLGPRAGEHGGEVVFQGSYAALSAGFEIADRPLSEG